MPDFLNLLGGPGGDRTPLSSVSYTPLPFSPNACSKYRETNRMGSPAISFEEIPPPQSHPPRFQTRHTRSMHCLRRDWRHGPPRLPPRRQKVREETSSLVHLSPLLPLRNGPPP